MKRSYKALFSLTAGNPCRGVSPVCFLWIYPSGEFWRLSLFLQGRKQRLSFPPLIFIPYPKVRDVHVQASHCCTIELLQPPAPCPAAFCRMHGSHMFTVLSSTFKTDTVFNYSVYLPNAPSESQQCVLFLKQFEFFCLANNCFWVLNVISHF